MKFLIFTFCLLQCSLSFAQSAQAPEPTPSEVIENSGPEPSTADTTIVVPTPKSERAEYFYAPPAGRTALQLSYENTPIYRTQTSTLPSGNYANDVTTSASSVALRGQYSITKNIAVSLNIQYRRDRNDYSAPNIAQSAKAAGVGDVGFGGLYQLPTSFARYYFALAATVSPQNSQMATTTTDGNETSGGWSLRPSVGMTKRLFTPNLRAGFEFAETILGQRSQGDNQSPENNVTTTGGESTSLNLFAEYKFPPLFLAAIRLNASHIASSNISAAGGTTFTGTADAYTTYGLGIEGDYSTNSWLTLKLAYDGTQFPARATSDSAGTTQVFVSNFTFAARFVF